MRIPYILDARNITPFLGEGTKSGTRTLKAVDLKEVTRAGLKGVNVTAFSTLGRRLGSSVDIAGRVLDSVILCLLGTWLKTATPMQKSRLQRDVTTMIDGGTVVIEPELRAQAARI